MSDGDLLLAAILSNPEDDNARLVYADWLQEQGGPRDEWHAKLIRLMCEKPEIRLAYNGKWRITPSRSLWRGARADLDNFLGHPLPRRFAVHRGFVYEVGPTCNEFVRNAGLLFATHPITHVFLSDRAPLGIGRWGWYASFDTTDGDEAPMTPKPHWIGEDIGRWLTGATIEPDYPLVRWYSTRDDADHAITRACLAFGHTEAARLRSRT